MPDNGPWSYEHDIRIRMIDCRISDLTNGLPTPVNFEYYTYSIYLSSFVSEPSSCGNTICSLFSDASATTPYSGTFVKM